MWMQKQVKTPADMKGLKIRVMENKVYVEMIKKLGGNPTPMAYGELYTALQQKTVDAAEGPIANLYTEKFFEVQKYVTVTEHSYSPSIVIVNNKLADKIGADNYKILIDTIKANTKFQRDLAVSEEKDKIELLKKAGVQIYTPTAEEKKLFVDAVKPVWDMFVPTVGQDLIDKIAAAK
jgi:TRAP-type C4-dicarboxylate transport system substrate-binding protein